jgi:hypothetical protein
MAPIYLGSLNFGFWAGFASRQIKELFLCKLKPAYILYNNSFRKTFFENHSIIVVAFSLTVCYTIFHRLISNSNREKEGTIQRQASLVQSHQETIERLNRDLVTIRNHLDDALRLKDKAIQARNSARQTIRQEFLLNQLKHVRVAIVKIDQLKDRLRGYDPKSLSTPDLEQSITEVIEALNMIEKLYCR